MHVLDARLGSQESTVKVNCQHLFPIGEGKLFMGNAGIRDEDVNPADLAALHALRSG